MDLQLWLTLVVKGRDVVTFVIPPGTSSFLGRDENDNDVVLHDPQVSRMHAKIVAQGEGYRIQDLQSAGGTLVNGQHVKGAVPLESDDMLQIGPYTLRVGIRRWRLTEGSEVNTTVLSIDADELGQIRDAWKEANR